MFRARESKTQQISRKICLRSDSTPICRPNQITEIKNRTNYNTINLMKQIKRLSLCLLRVQYSIKSQQITDEDDHDDDDDDGPDDVKFLDEFGVRVI